mgnify:CR=1 FL=1
MQHSSEPSKNLLTEAVDPAYYQDTFYFTMLISMSKSSGGSRDETKNDIRAFPEVLTVTLVEREKGGVQRDLETKYLSTLKIHVRRPRDIAKDIMMKRIVKSCGALKGVAVLRYKERKPTQRKKVFRGPGSYKITEVDYQKVRRQKAAEYARDKAEYLSTGPQKKGGAPFNRPASTKRGRSGPPIVGATGGAFGLEETLIDEAMVTADELPEDIVVAIDKSQAPRSYRAYYALKDNPNIPLKAGDLDRMEAGVDVYGSIYAALGQDFPYEGHYIVTTVKAADKYGPLLYDVIMELVGKAGLKPDTESVSDDASAVWKFYDEGSRPVRSAHLGPAGDPLPVDQYSTVMPYERAADPQQNQHLAKVYFDEGLSVLDALDKTGKLVDADDASAPSASEEFADLAKELDIPIIQKHQDLSRFDRLRESILVAVGGGSSDLMAFDIQRDLNQKIWDGDRRIRPGVRGALLDIADEFLEGLDLEVGVKDIIVTGSTANYNWSKFSDIDIHILVDFGEINNNTQLVKHFFDAVRSNWNRLHDIRVKAHEVEIYIQAHDEPHVSTGVYSLLDERWLVKPKKVKPQIDKATATKKMIQVGREVNKLAALYERGQYQRAFDTASRLKEKIKKMRQAGLERTGIYSPENLAFKMLRRSGDIEKLFSTYTRAYDKLYSLDQ